MGAGPRDGIERPRRLRPPAATQTFAGRRVADDFHDSGCRVPAAPSLTFICFHLRSSPFTFIGSSTGSREQYRQGATEIGDNGHGSPVGVPLHDGQRVSHSVITGPSREISWMIKPH